MACALAEPQLLQRGLPSGPLTPVQGGFVATPRGPRPIGLEGFSEDIDQDGFVDPIAEVAPVATPLAAAAPTPLAAAPAPLVPSPLAATAPLVAAAPVPTPLAAAVPASQFHAQDEAGAVSFGYQNEHSTRQEVRRPDGVTTGSYSYVDANGVPQTVNYIADALGFRVQATNLPVAPAPAAAPVPVAVVA